MVALVPPTLTVRADAGREALGRDGGAGAHRARGRGQPVAEAVTVKLVAEVAVFDEASVTTTLWAPLGTAGTVKVTVEDPLAWWSRRR